MHSSGRICALGLLALAPLPAQFRSLIAPGDGADVYFAINLPLKGSGQPEQGRIYKIGSTPLTLVAAVANSGFPDPCLGYCLTNAYDLQQPDLSRDRAILAYTGRADCTGSSTICGFHVNPYSTVVRGLPGKDSSTFGGLCRLSGSGRQLVCTRYAALYDIASLYSIDLSTGEQPAQPSATLRGQTRFTPNGRVVADDGTYVVWANGQFTVYRRGRVITIPQATGVQAVANAVLDSSGQTVVYQSCCSPDTELRIFNTDTQEDRRFLRGNGHLYDPVITADGQKVAFLSNAKLGTADPPGVTQVYIVNIDGAGLRALTAEADGVRQLTLSDDGQTAWYVANDALWQLNTATGQTRERVAPTGKAEVDPVVCAGSSTLITGSGLGGNLRVQFDGGWPPIVSRWRDRIWFQAPWDTPVRKSVPIRVDSDSPFESLATVVEVVASKPRFVTPAIHQDWSGFVTRASPARAGEYVNFYAVGLGPVQPAVATGVPGPVSPLAVAITPPDCNVPVAFAGLAPGLVGFYQVAVQIPADATGPIVVVSCSGAETSVALGP